MSITKQLRITQEPGNKRRAAFDLLSRILFEGGVIAYPTETVYGLGCLAFERAPVERIRALKGSRTGRPFILVIPSHRSVDRLVKVSDETGILIERFWPGPLTLVLEALEEVPAFLLGEDRTLAVRLSSSPFVQNLLARVKQPLVSTSANPEGLPPPSGPGDVIRYFEDHDQQIDLLVESSPGTMAGVASTVVSVIEREVSVLREGPITADDILRALQQ